MRNAPSWRVAASIPPPGEQSDVAPVTSVPNHARLLDDIEGKREHPASFGWVLRHIKVAEASYDEAAATAVGRARWARKQESQ